MNVLFFSGALPGNRDAGVNAILLRRARELERHASVVAVAPTPWAPRPIARLHPRWRSYSDIPATGVIAGVTVHYPRYLQLPLTAFAPFSGLSIALGALPLVRRLRAAGRCDVIFAQGVLPDGLAAALLGRWTGAASACTARGTDVNIHGISTPTGRRLLRWTLRHTDAAGAIAHDLADTMVREAGLATLPTVIYSGMDLERFTLGERRAARVALGLDPAAPLVLFVGRYSPEKRLPDLMAALALVRGRLPATRAALIGEGPERGVIERERTRHGLETAVQIVGERPYDEIPLWMQAANVLVLPSATEGFPSVVQEALCCGCPVVATAVGDVPRIVPAETGRVVPTRDPDALADALADVLQRSWNPERIRATIAPFTWERFASETDAFLRGAIARAKRRKDG